MRTNIVLDDEQLVKETMILGGAETRKDLVTNVFKEFVRTRRQRNRYFSLGSLSSSKNALLEAVL